MRRPSDARAGFRPSEFLLSRESVDRRVSERLLVELGESVDSLPFVEDSVDGWVAEVGVPISPGTSKLDLLTPSTGPMLIRTRSVLSVGLDCTGNRPTLLSRRCEPPLGLGAGDGALLRLPPAFSNKARWRSSWYILRLLSSVLMARGRGVSLVLVTEVEWPKVDIRFNSLKIAFLCAKRSRIRR